MPIFIKSAIPGLSKRTAAILQVGLFTIVGALALSPRDDAPLAVAQPAPAAQSAVETPAIPQEASLGFSTIDVVVSALIIRPRARRLMTKCCKSRQMI